MYRFRPGFGAFSSPPANISTILANASASSGVPQNILNAVAYQESSYNPNAVSSAGAQGLLQLMPATGKSLGVSNPFDAQQNADAGAKYLSQLYAQYGDWSDALVAYNEGPGAFAAHGAYPSSASYASTILANAGIDPSQTITPPSGIDSTGSGGDGSGDSSTSAATFDLSSISPVWWLAGGLGLLGFAWVMNR